MTSPDRSAALATYLDRVAAGDLPGAVRVCTDLVEAGHPVRSVICDVLVPAQADTGARWEQGIINVAGEHAATSITDAALAALASTLDEPSTGTPVLMVCAEGEWHSLPARMTAVLLQLHGWPVRFVGASTPAADIGDYAADVGPLASVLSVTVASFLPGATRTVAAMHRHGVAVLAGGPAFGADDHRAQAIGADAWAAHAADADRHLRRWAHHRPPAPRPSDHTPPGATAHQQVRHRHAAAVDAAFADLSRRLADLSAYDQGQLDHTRADLSSILDFLEAALLVDDPTVLTDMLGWLVAVLSHRGVPRRVVAPGLAALATALDDVPAARDLLLRAAEQPQP